MADQCSVCKFFYPEAPDRGVCRRYPPQMVIAQTAEQTALAVAAKQAPQKVMITAQMSGVFPYVASIGWCGEFGPTAAAVN